MDKGLHNQQHHWRLDGSEMQKIFHGSSPSQSGELQTTPVAPEGFAFTPGAERPEEFSPGLTPELMELVEQASQLSKT
jgi:Mn-containing catalase